MSTPENLSSSPAPTPSTQYLERFRATLEKRWKEFDSAVAADAWVFANMRFDIEKYQSAKAAFDEGRSLLVSIQNDAELKIAMKWPGRFSSILKTLENYSSQLSQAEKEKWYNRVLAGTLADLTTLKSQVIQVVEDKNTDEAVHRVTDEPPPRIEWANNPLASAWDDLANTVRSAAPAIQDTVAKLGAAAVGTGLIDKKGWGEMVKEWFTTFKEWILKFFDDDSLLGKMLGGMKDKVKWILSLIGMKLGIKTDNKDAQSSWNFLSSIEKRFWPEWANKVFKKLLESKKTSTDIQEYFTHENILALSRNQLRTLISSNKDDKKSLALELSFQESEGEKIYRAIELLLSEDARSLMKENGIKDADDVPIGKLFTSVARYADFLEKIKEKWTKLDISHFSFGDGAKIWVGEFIWEKKELLEHLKEKFEGFTPHVLYLIHTSYSTKSLLEPLDPKANELSLEEPEKKFMTQTLPEYGKKLPNMLKQFGFGSPEAERSINDYLQKPGLTYKDAIDFFIVSWGNADMDAMNAFEKAQVIMKITMMLRFNKWSEQQAYSYLTTLVWAISLGDSKIRIPDDVKIILKDLEKIVINASLALLKEWKLMLQWVWDANPILSTWVLAGLWGIFYLAFKLTPVGRIASTFMTLLTLAWISTAAYAGYKITDGKIVEEKTGKLVADVSELEKLQKQKEAK